MAESVAILLLGDRGVGKTTTMRSYIPRGRSHTLDAWADSGEVCVMHNGRPVTVYAEECSHLLSCRPLSYPRRDLFVIIFDTNDRPSFDSAQAWFDEVSSLVPDAEFVLCGNVKAAGLAKAVSPEEARASADVLGPRCLGSYEFSAKSQEGVERIFDDVIGFVLAKRDHERRRRGRRCRIA